MKVTYPTGSHDLQKIDVSDTHVAFAWGLDSPEYPTALAIKRSRGEKVYMVDTRGNKSGYPLEVDGLILIGSSFFDSDSLLFSPVVRCVDDYVKAGKLLGDAPLIIGASENVYSRPAFIKYLVENRLFNHDKEHWLYGVPNPAELGVYPLLFTSYVVSNITMAVCTSCFLYSLYGVLFSSNIGRIEKLPSVNDHEDNLGMTSKFINYKMSREQIRVFYKNQGIVSDFASGADSSDFYSHYVSYTEGI